MPKMAFPSLKKPPFILDESMPIYSPTGFLDITNATLRTSNTECQNLQIGSGNVYVTTDLTSNLVLNLENITNLGNSTSNTMHFTNATTGLVADSNIVVTGNVTAGSFLGDGSGLTSIPPSAITGTLSQWSDGTNSDVYIASNVGIGNVHTLTSNTLQVGANLYVRDADANVLTVTGNVAADYFEGDGSKLTGISSTLQAITDSGNVTSNTVQFTNATTGFVTTSNIEVGGALKINTITAAAYHSLQAVTNVGNVTSNTVQFSNATTGLVTTGNVEVGRDLSVTGNLTVLGTRTIVDTDTLRVKDPIIELGKDNPGTGDLGLVMTRPSGSSNVAMIFDESTDTLEIGYTQSNASDTDITMRTAATEPLDVNVNGNVSVGKELTVSGNVAVDTDTLFVDSVNNRVGVGTIDPAYSFDVQTSSDASDKTMTRLYSAANATGVSSTGLILEKGTGYGGVIKGFISQGIGSGLSLHTLNGGTEAQAMTIMNSGNVGIGTTNPIDLLDVHYPNPSYGSFTGTEEGSLTVSAGAEQSNAAVYFRTPFDAAAPAKRAIFSDGGSFSGGGSGGLHFCLESSADNTTKVDLTDSKMMIKQNGDVGIGTTPSEKLHVHENLATSGHQIMARIGGDTSSYNTLVFGSKEGRPHIGGHRGDFGAWADLSLQNDSLIISQSGNIVNVNGTLRIQGYDTKRVLIGYQKYSSSTGVSYASGTSGYQDAWSVTYTRVHSGSQIYVIGDLCLAQAMGATGTTSYRAVLGRLKVNSGGVDYYSDSVQDWQRIDNSFHEYQRQSRVHFNQQALSGTTTGQNITIYAQVEEGGKSGTTNSFGLNVWSGRSYIEVFEVM